MKNDAYTSKFWFGFGSLIAATAIGLGSVASSTDRFHQTLQAREPSASVPFRRPAQQAEQFSLNYLTLRHHLTLHMLSAVGLSTEEKGLLVSNARHMIERYHRQDAQVFDVRTQRDLDEIMMKLMPLDNLMTDLKGLRSGQIRVPPKVMLRIHDPALAQKIEALDQSIRKKDLVVPVGGKLKTWLAQKLFNNGQEFLLFDALARGDKNTERALSTIDSYSDEQRAQLIDLAETKVRDGIQFIRTLGEQFLRAGYVTGGKPELQRVIEIVLTEYFRDIPESWVMEMVAALALRPDITDLKERGKVIIGRTGPDFQKFLQLLSRWEGLSPDAREILKTVEESVAPVRWSLLEPMLADHESDLKNLKVDPVAIATASMAQIHKATAVNRQGQTIEIAARFLKPYIESRHATDSKILMGVAAKIDADPIVQKSSLPKVQAMVGDLIEMATTELDASRTEANQVEAGHVYDQSITVKTDQGTPFLATIRAPKIYPVRPLRGKQKLLLQEWVNGNSMESVMKHSLPEAQLAFEAFAELWIYEAMQGFFHSDIHPGNIKIRLVPGAKNEAEIFLLDYGMVGRLDSDYVSRLLYFVMAARSTDSKVITDAIWDISDPGKNQLTKSALESLVVELLKAQNGEPVPFDRFLGQSVRAGIALPHDVAEFSRGIGGLIGMGKWLEKKLPFGKVAQRMAIQRPGQVLSAIGLTDLTDVNKLDNTARMLTDIFARYAKTQSIEKSKVLGDKVAAGTQQAVAVGAETAKDALAKSQAAKQALETKAESARVAVTDFVASTIKEKGRGFFSGAAASLRSLPFGSPSAPAPVAPTCEGLFSDKGDR